MLLLNVRQYGKEGSWSFRIGKDGPARIHNAPTATDGNELQIDAQGALLFPGFVNSHEHLGFNCYPALGNRKYGNYREWGAEIHREHKELIEKIKDIPLPLRIQWGMYKNLLNGFTTVVNHGAELKIEDLFINVIQRYPPLHSVGFEKHWKRKLWNPFQRSKTVMHIGEGIDEVAAREPGEVVRANLFKKEIIAVHGITLGREEAKHFRGLVWCPASNYFLFDDTADIPALLGKIDIVFGTDSTLTSPWNAWSQFRKSIQKGRVTEEALLDMLTGRATELWDLQKRNNDIILIRPQSRLFESGPSDVMLVITQGKIRLIDEELRSDPALDSFGFSRIRIGGKRKLVWGDLPSLAGALKNHYPDLEVPFSTE